jgi:hypothetical protein
MKPGRLKLRLRIQWPEARKDQAETSRMLLVNKLMPLWPQAGTCRSKFPPQDRVSDRVVRLPHR